MARFNLNYHPGYDIKELENQPLIDNPDIALIKKGRRYSHLPRKCELASFFAGQSRVSCVCYSPKTAMKGESPK
jgi:hypothetical protein